MLTRPAVTGLQHADAAVNLAGLLQARTGGGGGGEADEAEDLYRQALGAAPHNVVALASFGAFLHDVRGRVEAARRLLERAVDLRPDYTPALTSLASILQSEGRGADEVESMFERALAAHRGLTSQLPADDKPQSNLVASDPRGSRAQQDALSAAMRRMPCTEAAACCSSFAGWLWEVRGDTSRAANLWGDALALDPSSLAALRGASRLFAHEAYSSLGAAGDDGPRKKAPQESAFQKNLAAHAELLYQRAVALEPRHVATRYNYAAFLHRLSTSAMALPAASPAAPSATRQHNASASAARDRRSLAAAAQAR